MYVCLTRKILSQIYIYKYFVVVSSLFWPSQLELQNTPTVCLQRSKTPNECPVAQSTGAAEFIDCISAEESDFLFESLGYDTKQSDGEVPVMLELWGMRSTPSLASLPGSLWLWVVLFTNPSARAGYDTRSIFKRSLTGLNSEFFLLLD